MTFIGLKWVAWAAAIAQAVLILETNASSCPGLLDILPLATQIETTQVCVDAQKYASELLQSCQDLEDIEKCLNNSVLLPNVIDSAKNCAGDLCKRRALNNVIQKLHHCDRSASDYASEILDLTCHLMPHDDCVQAKKIVSVFCKDDPLDVCKEKVSVLTKSVNCPATQYNLRETQFNRLRRLCPNSDDLSAMIERFTRIGNAASCDSFDHFISVLTEKCGHRQDRVFCLLSNVMNDSENLKLAHSCVGKLFDSAAFLLWSGFQGCNMSIENYFSSLDLTQCGAVCEMVNTTCGELMMAQEICQTPINQLLDELSFAEGYFLTPTKSFGLTGSYF